MPTGSPLLPHANSLPTSTMGYRYVLYMTHTFHTTDAHIYGLRVVATGKPISFYIELWDHEKGNDWKNLTLKYSQKITLAPEAKIQEVRHLYSEAALIRTSNIWMPQLYEQFDQDKIYQINAFLLQLYGCHTYPNTFALHQSVRISVASL